MNQTGALAPLLAHLRREPSRTWSLIITLYGDAVVPRCGRLWLGTLLEIFAALGINGNVVRTAMSRLTTDAWLERTRLGRNSYYRLADKGQLAFAEAAQRIYGAQRPLWDGAFRLAILGGTERDPARLALEAAGFVLLAPGVLVAASGDLPGLSHDIIMLRAAPSEKDASRLANRLWPSERLAEGYRRFLAAFEPWAAQIGGDAALSDLQALVARLLLIHEYRRLILRDPLLPTPLLPEAWPGHAARALCAQLYAMLLPASERWLSENALNEDGPLPPPPSLADRFSDCYALQNS